MNTIKTDDYHFKFMSKYQSGDYLYDNAAKVVNKVT